MNTVSCSSEKQFRRVIAAILADISHLAFIGLCVGLSSGDSGSEKNSIKPILASRTSCPAPQRGSDGGFPHLQSPLLLIGSGASAGLVDVVESSCTFKISK